MSQTTHIAFAIGHCEKIRSINQTLLTRLGVIFLAYKSEPADIRYPGRLVISCCVTFLQSLILRSILKFAIMILFFFVSSIISLANQN